MPGPGPVGTGRATDRPAMRGRDGMQGGGPYREIAFYRGCLFATVISLAGYCVIAFAYYAGRHLLGF